MTQEMNNEFQCSNWKNHFSTSVGTKPNTTLQFLLRLHKMCCMWAKNGTTWHISTRLNIIAGHRLLIFMLSRSKLQAAKKKLTKNTYIYLYIHNNGLELIFILWQRCLSHRKYVYIKICINIYQHAHTYIYTRNNFLGRWIEWQIVSDYFGFM